MIGSLTGTVQFAPDNPVIINVAGVGYRVFVTPSCAGKIAGTSTVTLYVHTHVHDDGIDLYGFLTRQELNLFTLLLSVPGIGPKTATLVVDRGEGAVRQAVASADVSFFTSIPRLGKKNAQKIIIELKSKLGSLTELDLTSDISGETAQLIEALSTMGFARKEILEAIRNLREQDITLEGKLKYALKILAKRVP